jgi:hypothetical protein
MIDIWDWESPGWPTDITMVNPAGYWVMFFAGNSHYILEGVFSTLSKVRDALRNYYEPQGLRVVAHSWAEGAVEFKVGGPDPSDEKTILDMSFLAQYRKLDEFTP